MADGDSENARATSPPTESNPDQTVESELSSPDRSSSVIGATNLTHTSVLSILGDQNSRSKLISSPGYLTDKDNVEADLKAFAAKRGMAVELLHFNETFGAMFNDPIKTAGGVKVLGKTYLEIAANCFGIPLPAVSNTKKTPADKESYAKALEDALLLLKIIAGCNRNAVAYEHGKKVGDLPTLESLLDPASSVHSQPSTGTKNGEQNSKRNKKNPVPIHSNGVAVSQNAKVADAPPDPAPSAMDVQSYPAKEAPKAHHDTPDGSLDYMTPQKEEGSEIPSEKLSTFTVDTNDIHQNALLRRSTAELSSDFQDLIAATLASKPPEPDLNFISMDTRPEVIPPDLLRDISYSEEIQSPGSKEEYEIALKLGDERKRVIDEGRDKGKNRSAQLSAFSKRSVPARSAEETKARFSGRHGGKGLWSSMMTGFTKKDEPEPVASAPVSAPAPSPVKSQDKPADAKAKPVVAASEKSKETLKAEQDAQTLKAMQQVE